MSGEMVDSCFRSRSSPLWPALGAGPPRSDFSGDIVHPLAVGDGYVSFCCRDAGPFRHGAGRLSYRRLIAAFERIFGATIFFGTEKQLDPATVFQQARFNFMSEARLWYWRDGAQQLLPEVGENVVVLSPEFYREISSHPIPTDLQAARALSGSPAALDLYNWLCYRCHIAKANEKVALFGEFGLTRQLGMAEYKRPRKFREKLEGWLKLVKLMWPDCPAQISRDGLWLELRPASAIVGRAEHCLISGEG